MQTDSSDNRRSRLRYALIVALAAVVAASGCEYLGLDQSGGSGGGQDKSQAADEAKTKADKQKASEDSDQGATDEQASAGDESADESAGEEEEDPTPKPPSLDDSVPGTAEEGDEQERRRNPFAASPDLQAEAEETDREDAPERSGPLQRYSYEKYRLAGLISEVAVPKAMFIAPDSVGHVLKKGDRLGKEGGVIQDIRENEVELELPPEGEDGRPKEVTVELREAEVSETQQRKEGLSEEEKKTLDRLLQSEEGRQAVRQKYKDRASEGDRGSGRSQQRQRQRGGGFQGLEPPED